MTKNSKAALDFTQQIPTRRFRSPGEIAAAIVFLSSDEATFTVGSELVIDGRMSTLLRPPCRVGQSDSFAEAAPSSLSNSSTVGRLPFHFSGRLSASRYSDMPMGLLISRSVLGDEAIPRLAQDEAIPRLAQNDADTWLVVGMTKEVVDG
jgi:hypothetical protein